MNRKTLLAAGLIASLSVAGLSNTAAAASYVIKMKFNDDTGDLYFEPASLKIQPGDTVVWIQDDEDNEHNIAAYPSKIPAGTDPFLSPMMTKVGETWSQTFTKVGSYFFHCHPHEAAGMRGLIIVGRQSLPEEFRRPEAGEMQHDHGGGDNMMDHDMKHDGKMPMDHGDKMTMKHGEGHGEMKEEMKEKMMEKMNGGDGHSDHHHD